MSSTPDDPLQQTKSNDGQQLPSSKPAEGQTQKANNSPLDWFIISLCLCLSLPTIANLAVPVALPTIAADLQGEVYYAWAGCAYSLTILASSPFIHAIADTWGCKPALLLCVGFFVVGSGMSGLASSMEMLVAGRAVQGLGGGSIHLLLTNVLRNLGCLPVQKAMYMKSLLAAWAALTALGPFVGGTFAYVGQWRLVFLMNIPIGLVALVAIHILNLPVPNVSGRVVFMKELKRIDPIGHTMIMASLIAIFSGILSPSAAPQRLFGVNISVIVGCCGFILFVVYEAKVASRPMIPWTTLTNRTSVSGYIQSFLVGVCSLCVIYYVPVYLHTVRGTSAINLAFLVSPLGISSLASILGSLTVQVKGTYRPAVWTSWLTLMNSMSLLNMSSDQEMWLGFFPVALLCIGSTSGFIHSTSQYPVHAPLSTSDHAPATRFQRFISSLSGACGVAIGWVILKNRFHINVPAKPAEQLKATKRFQMLWALLLLLCSVGWILAFFVMKAVELHRSPGGLWTWQKPDPVQQPTELTSVEVAKSSEERDGELAAEQGVKQDILVEVSLDDDASV